MGGPVPQWGGPVPPMGGPVPVIWTRAKYTDFWCKIADFATFWCKIADFDIFWSKIRVYLAGDQTTRGVRWVGVWGDVSPPPSQTPSGYLALVQITGKTLKMADFTQNYTKNHPFF